MPSIQSGEAQILTYTDGEMLSFRFENCITLILQSLVYDTWVSYSEGGLQSASQRFKVAVQSDGSTKHTPLTLNFSQPRSGTLFFASANAGATSTLCMWQI